MNHAQHAIAVFAVEGPVQITERFFVVLHDAAHFPDGFLIEYLSDVKDSFSDTR